MATALAPTEPAAPTPSCVFPAFDALGNPAVLVPVGLRTEPVKTLNRLNRRARASRARR